MRTQARGFVCGISLALAACGADDSKSCGDASSCPAGMVRVSASCGAFCMDATEVTRSAYASFLAANPDLAGQPNSCSWNTSFNAECPTGAPPGSDSQLPVTCVDWCDAQTFCKSVGKKLCTGGPHSDEEGQWSVACKKSFGNLQSGPPECNIFSGQLKPVGSSPGCHADGPPLDTLKDIVGNAAEWTDDCLPIDGIVYCSAPGASAFEGDPLCASSVMYEATLRDPFVGFRCCSE